MCISDVTIFFIEIIFITEEKILSDPEIEWNRVDRRSVISILVSALSEIYQNSIQRKKKIFYEECEWNSCCLYMKINA